MLGFIPLHRELIRRANDETSFIESDSLGGLEPRTYRVVGKFVVRFVENALPGVFRGQLHRYSKTEGIFSRARDVTGGLFKCQSGLDRRKIVPDLATIRSPKISGLRARTRKFLLRESLVGSANRTTFSLPSPIFGQL